MPNTSAPLQARVRIGGPEEIIAAVPYLLGFHPRESVVAVGLRGRRSRVCITLRFDLPTDAAPPTDVGTPPSISPSAPAEATDAPTLSTAVLADLIATQLRRGGADQAVIIVTANDRDAATAGSREVTTAVERDPRTADGRTPPPDRTDPAVDGEPPDHTDTTAEGALVARIRVTADGLPADGADTTVDGLPPARADATVDGEALDRTQATPEGELVARIRATADGQPADRAATTGNGQPADAAATAAESHTPPPYRALATAVASSLRKARVGVRDVLCVQGDRWWSYVCAEPSCCPPEGRPVPTEAPDALVAAMVVEGRVVHAGREELAATVETAPRDDEVAWLRSFADAEERHRQRAVPAIARHTVFGEIEAAVRARAEASGSLTDDEAARYCVALAEVQLRDACLRWLDGPLADAAETLWRELTRAAAPPYAAAPATLLGLHAYARGDGTFAQICLDRALADDPLYTLALLVREGLDEGIPPAAIRKLAACVEAAEADA